MADETYKGEFYCVKCKAKREAGRRLSCPTTAVAWPGPVPRLWHEPQPHPRQGLIADLPTRAPIRTDRGPRAIGLWTAPGSRVGVPDCPERRT